MSLDRTRGDFLSTHKKQRLALAAAFPLLIVALVLMIVAALSVLPYHVHAHHPVALLLSLVVAAIVLTLSAYLCLHLPERAYRKWQKHETSAKEPSEHPPTTVRHQRARLAHAVIKAVFTRSPRETTEVSIDKQGQVKVRASSATATATAVAKSTRSRSSKQLP